MNKIDEAYNFNQESIKNDRRITSPSNLQSISQSEQLAFQVSDASDSSNMQIKAVQIQKANGTVSRDSIIIYICAPSFQFRKVAIVPTDPLYVVNPIFPGDRKVYFYNGNILNPNRSFSNYNISNGDRIVTVPIEQMNLNLETFWRKTTRNSANNKERFNLFHDQQTKYLFARNNDLVLFKAENRPISNQHLTKNLLFLIDDKSSTYFKTALVLEFPKVISEEPLPILW
jgi:hypothetical protein